MKAILSATITSSRLVKIQISTTISKFRSAALLGRFRRPRCGSNKNADTDGRMDGGRADGRMEAYILVKCILTVISALYPNGKTRIWFRKRFSALHKSYPRFIQKDKTRILFKKRFSALYKSYPRFIQKDKTRIWFRKRFSALYKSYPRSILLDKTRIWFRKRFQPFMMADFHCCVFHT